MSEAPFRRGRQGFRPIRKIRSALEGIKCAVFLDFSVAYKLGLSVVFLTVAAIFETLFHFLFVLAVTGLMLVAEVFNTALEATCDFIQPTYDDRIKAIKDIAAGAVLIAILIWYATASMVLWELFAGQEVFTAF